jgi:hypothetical protein
MSQIQTIACLKDGQYKKEFYMRNLIKMLGIIAILAIIGLTFSCEVAPEDQVTITITSIPDGFNGKYAAVALLTDNTDENSIVAFSYYFLPIASGRVTAEMFDTDRKAFGKDGSYYVFILINDDEDGETEPDAYKGISRAKQGVVKGGNSFAATIFTPTMTGPTVPVDPDKPPVNNFGTYTATYAFNATVNVTETITLTEDSFYIKDNANGAGATPDDLTFSIESWETADVPTSVTGYTGAYKFSGKITAAHNDTANASSTDAVKRGDYIPSTYTAPNFTRADINSATCYMYIYFKGEAGNITFVRTSFTKNGTTVPAIVSPTVTRVYTKQP